MPLRDFIDPGGRMLVRRLDELCSHLESLSVRLRGTLINALGDTIGGMVRDVALGVLDAFTRCLPGSPPTRPAPRYERDYFERDDYESIQDNYWGDQENDRDWDADRSGSHPVPAKPRRISTALSAGLVAAAFWLRRSGHGRLIVTACTICLIATGIAFFGGPVAIAAIDLATSAGQVTSLADAIGGRSMFGWLNSA